LTNTSPLTVFWFRRDLRLNDNAALHFALKGPNPVLCLFIFDTDILDKLDNKKDARLTFIHQEVLGIKKELEEKGSSVLIKHGNPLTVWKELIQSYLVAAVYSNHDFEPYAITRDNEVKSLLNQAGIGFYSYKDQVIFEKNEIVKEDGTPYTVFTPYSKTWKLALNDFYLKPYPTEKYADKYFKTEALPILSLKQLGFAASEINFPSREFEAQKLMNYDKTRDLPALNGTSKLSVHLRFGTISIRDIMSKAMVTNEKWFNELIWREFYMQILFHFPHVVSSAFKPSYDRIEWVNDVELFEKWCTGHTGYPIVDAGMRELNATGYMHNRIRMVVASFLTKHLLTDWRWGEAYFAKKLLDFELSSNNGGWQWAAGSGVDAAPYFRIFNPYLQTEKFDSNHVYIRQWVPEFDSKAYPAPVIDHQAARERCLRVYKNALSV